MNEGTSNAITPFGARLSESMARRGPLCVGIDPHPQLLEAWGLPDTVDGLARFCDVAVEALAGEVAALKPQSAFFERFGSGGIAVLEQTIAAARAAGSLVIMDVKRGDIGSTMDGYAHAYLDRSSPLFSDAMTASPYLGFGSLTPLFDRAMENGSGVFVLALTSNPGAEVVQHAVTGTNRTVAQTVLDGLAELNKNVHPLGSFGAVIGATVGKTNHELSTVNGPFLAPGIGAQGAIAADLRVVFGSALHAVVPTTSRGVLRAGPAVPALRAAARAELEMCTAVLRTA